VEKVSIKVRISSKIHPTESKEKVLSAIKNIISPEKIEKITEETETTDWEIVIEGHIGILGEFKRKIAIRKIRDLVRQFLYRNRVGNRTCILLNKQAAFAKNVNLCENRNDSPLGPITIEILGDNEEDIEIAIAWLTENEYNALSI